MIWIGIAAEMGTACTWAISNMAHSTGTRLSGVHPLMMLRQLLAVIALIPLCLLAGQFQSYALEALAMAFIFGVICGRRLYKNILRIGIRPALIRQSLCSCPKTGRRGAGIGCGADHGVGHGVVEDGPAAGDSPAHALPAAEHRRRRVVSAGVGLQPVAPWVVFGIRERRCPSPGSILGSRTVCSGAAILLLR